MNYWKECIETAFNEAGIKATPEQIKSVVECVDGAHENYSMAYPVPESPYKRELEETKKELKREKEKTVCEECKGKGQFRIDGPAHYSYSDCHKCHGKGFIYR